MNRSCWNTEPPFSHPPKPSIAAGFPQWHLPCERLDENQQDQESKRYECQKQGHGNKQHSNPFGGLKIETKKQFNVRTSNQKWVLFDEYASKERIVLV